MAYDGFLRFGGNEIVNSERARSRALSADCPPGWFIKGGCDSLMGAVGDTSYEYSAPAATPWFDPQAPDVSNRFLGVYGLGMAGLQDSTGSAPVTEGVADGGVIGRTRKGVREVRVTATLAALGKDALEYGLSWLAAALEPGACGQHGDACGTTDVDFFVDCPPERVTETTYTPYREAARNYHVNPIPSVLDEHWESYESASRSLRTDEPEPYVQFLKSGTSTNWNLGDGGVNTSSSAGSPINDESSYSASVWVRPYREFSLRLVLYFLDESGSTISLRQSAEVTVPPGEWAKLDLTDQSAPTGAARAALIVSITGEDGGTDVTLGARIDMKKAIITKADGATVPDYFDGNSAPTYDSEGGIVERYVWTGTSQLSASALEVRDPVPPETDEEYQARVDEYRRFLHDTSVTTAPFVTDRIQSPTRDDLVGVRVEWTFTSEHPYIYGIPRPLELSETITAAYSDIPYNLMRYPGAEVGDGIPRAIATNYVHDGSAEYEGDDWGLSLSSPNFTSVSESFSTDISAVGTHSFKKEGTSENAPSEGRLATGIRVTGLGLYLPFSGDSVSVSMWAYTDQSGDNVIEELTASIRWRGLQEGNSTTTVIGSTTTEFDGHTFSATGVAVPPNTASAEMAVTARYSLNSDGVVHRLYLDAFSMTIP